MKRTSPAPIAEAAGGHDGDERDRRRGDDDIRRKPGVGTGKGDPDELGDDRQEVEEKEVADTEPSPSSPKRSLISRA